MLRFASYRPFLSLTFLMAVCLFPAVPMGAVDESPPFSATYSVRYGILRGEMTLELKQHDASYTYETALRPRGFVSWLRRGEIRETSRLVTADHRVQPSDYSSIDTIAKPTRITNYVFDQPPGRVTGEYKSRAVDMPMKPGGQNRISVQIAIMRALQANIEPTEFSVFDRGRWRDFKIEIFPDQVAETPSGDFETVEVRYAYTDKPKSWSMHCATALHYLPVMIVYHEDGKVRSRAVLTAYQVGE